MKLKDYQIEYYDAKLLSEEIIASNSVDNFTGLKVITGGVAVNGTSILNVNDLDNVFVNHNPLETYKEKAYVIIDENTESNIFAGFTFDTKLFSMSLSAQINWSNLFFIPQAMFPLPVMTKDEQLYLLDYSNLNAFYGTALSHKNTALQNGNNTKQQVKNATSIEEVDNIINNL